jgi:hypothetical protein
MSDEHEDRPAPDSIDQPPVDTSRRRFLGGAAVLGVGGDLECLRQSRRRAGQTAASAAHAAGVG